MADFTALRGIVCPVVSPCTSNEGVDYDSLQENLARLLRAPITGFYVCGCTGDGSRLTFAERCRTAELTIAQTRAAGRRTIVHVGQTLQRHALELAEHAMTLGADAVASVPPQGGWSETVAYYTALAAQAPVFIYYIPGLTRVSADYDQLRQLLDLPGVAGIKVSDWNIFLIRRIKADYPEKIVYTGLDEMVVPGLLYGADGSIGTWINLLAGVLLQALDACAGRPLRGAEPAADGLYGVFAQGLAVRHSERISGADAQSRLCGKMLPRPRRLAARLHAGAAAAGAAGRSGRAERACRVHVLTSLLSLEEPVMQFTTLPGTGISVSRLCLGTMTFGSPVAEPDAIRLVHDAAELGVNFIDTANMYEGYNRFAGSAGGVAEEIVGKAVAARRADFVVATKLGMKVGDTPVDENTSPEAIRVQLRRSLRRMNTDYIDLYYLHRYDSNTAPGEIARAIGEELKAGTIRAWGVSNYSAEQLSALLAAAREENIPLPSMCQPPLSLLNTGALDALLPLCAQEGIGVIPYQVLQGGILTGKYHAGQQPPAGSRAAEKPDWMKPMTDEVYATLARVEAEAKAAGQSMTQYALAWALRQPAVRCVLLGVKRRAQLEEAAAIF